MHQSHVAAAVDRHPWRSCSVFLGFSSICLHPEGVFTTLAPQISQDSWHNLGNVTIMRYRLIYSCRVTVAGVRPQLSMGGGAAAPLITSMFQLQCFPFRLSTTVCVASRLKWLDFVGQKSKVTVSWPVHHADESSPSGCWPRMNRLWLSVFSYCPTVSLSSSALLSLLMWTQHLEGNPNYSAQIFIWSKGQCGQRSVFGHVTR